MKNFKKFTACFCSLLLISLFVANSITANAAAKLTSTNISVAVNESKNIVIKNKNKKAAYTYTSSDKSVATVSKSGVVKGVAEGSATITVKSMVNKKSEKVGTANVTVKAAVAEPTAVPTVALTPEQAQHDSIIKRALVSTGNNTRIKNVIEKARKGETVTLAYIGGSITDGAMSSPYTNCYAYSSYSYFKKTFGKGDGSNVKFVNAGLSGTPSGVGMVRYDKDVVQQAGRKPDIVFVEFAVNDGGDVVSCETYESLIRNILKTDNNPAVVLLFSVFRGGSNCQVKYQPIGKYYDLPMVSIRDGIMPLINSKKMKDSDFWHADGLHPVNAGHKLYAESIDNLFDTIDKEKKAASDITIPDAPKAGKDYEGIQMIDNKTTSSDYTITTGGFSAVDNDVYTSYHDGSRKSFPNNWKHTATAGNDSFKMTITCKNLELIYKSGNKATAGKADVYVDGVKKATLDSAEGGNWLNPLPSAIIKDKTAASHTVEIKMADDSTSKEFTIEAFGYTK